MPLSGPDGGEDATGRAPSPGESSVMPLGPTVAGNRNSIVALPADLRLPGRLRGGRARLRNSIVALPADLRTKLVLRSLTTRPARDPSTGGLTTTTLLDGGGAS